ncbi:hypothetical protein EJ110_NYTH15385 [Nymphaea thermarum]|nr:hypothetical protein EJ110_NYTH15385 [Nymphaea thermarum]
MMGRAGLLFKCISSAAIGTDFGCIIEGFMPYLSLMREKEVAERDSPTITDGEEKANLLPPPPLPPAPHPPNLILSLPTFPPWKKLLIKVIAVDKTIVKVLAAENAIPWLRSTPSVSDFCMKRRSEEEDAVDSGADAEVLSCVQTFLPLHSSPQWLHVSRANNIGDNVAL